MSRFGSLGTQYFDDAGDPLIDGLVYFYQPNSTTDKDTFADVSLTIPNTNPVLLTGAGRQPNIFFNGSASAILTTASGVQIEDRDPVGGDQAEAAFSDWNASTIYNSPDIVVGSDDAFYLSITNGNEGNDPTSSATNWTQIRFIRVWNVNETYGAQQIVEGSDGLLYSAVTGSNLGNDPTTDPANWKGAAESDVPAVIRAAAKTYAYRNF